MACQCQPPHAPRRGIGVRTRRRHLAAAALTALVVRRISGYENRPSPACASRRATPKGVERAPGSGTLPPRPRKGIERVPGSGLLLPPCVVERRKVRGGRGGLCRGVVKAGARSLRPCNGEGAGIFPQKSGKMRKAYAVRRVSRLLISSLPQNQADCFSALPKNSLRSRRRVAGPGGGGRSAPAGVPGQSPGPPEAETTRTCGRSRRRCDRRNRDCCSAPP